MPIATAKLFASGGSQAVRLPAEFRFDDLSEVYIRRDTATGDVILSARAPADWEAFMQRRARIGANVPDDFLGADERRQGSETRDPFAGWNE
ncbi:antitoxin [Pseudorhodoferax sp.]|uniref:antitoxin n=1 Tax=Pseudorhodoferax sp. TaxID=1993553 RepID=UPI0039E2F5A4